MQRDEGQTPPPPQVHMEGAEEGSTAQRSNGASVDGWSDPRYDNQSHSVCRPQVGAGKTTPPCVSISCDCGCHWALQRRLTWPAGFEVGVHRDCCQTCLHPCSDCGFGCGGAGLPCCGSCAVAPRPCCGSCVAAPGPANQPNHKGSRHRGCQPSSGVQCDGTKMTHQRLPLQT